MSLVDELGARVRAGADALPLDLVALAVDRLRAAGELLLQVRQASADPMGVPRLGHATERAEHAAHALRVAQHHLADYLTALGLGAAGRAAPEPHARPRPQVRAAQPAPSPPEHPAPSLTHWWPARVAELTAEEHPPGDSAGPGATGSDELLRRVAAGVRGGDRGRLRHDLAAAPPAVGLALSALTPPLLHRLAGELLGHPPRADDLPRLARATGSRVRSLLPGMPPPVLDTLLSRVCRIPPPGDGAAARPDHPADAAVAGAVLTGVLLELLGHAPESRHPRAAAPVAPGAARPAAPDRARRA